MAKSLFASDAELLTALASEDRDVFPKADAAFMRDADPAKARRFLKLLFTPEFEDVRYGGCGLVFLTVLAKHGEPIPPKYDDLIYLDYNEEVVDMVKRWRLVFEKIPMARRVKKLTRGAIKDSGTRRLVFEATLDIAPQVAVNVLADARNDEAKLRRVLDDLQGVRIPEVVAAMKKYALPPLPPPPPKEVGPYRFEGPVIVNPADYASLDKVRKEQYRIAAGNYVGGGPVKNPRDFIARLRRHDLDESDAEMRTWRVMRGATHAFDLWVVWVDNGTFFQPGSAKPAPVQIIQSSFLPTDKKPASAALAKDLANSEPKTGLWTAPKKKKAKAR